VIFAGVPSLPGTSPALIPVPPRSKAAQGVLTKRPGCWLRLYLGSLQAGVWAESPFWSQPSWELSVTGSASGLTAPQGLVLYTAIRAVQRKKFDAEVSRVPLDCPPPCSRLH